MGKEFWLPRIATQENVNAKWGGGFWCKLCGHKFIVGDYFHYIYCNSTKGVNCGNFVVCEKCDGPDVIQRGFKDCSAAYEAAKRWGMIDY